jgi:response regulator RpfG family c-di-GMP phosphodiesterase
LSLPFEYEVVDPVVKAHLAHSAALPLRLEKRLPAIEDILHRVEATDPTMSDHANETGAIAGRMALFLGCTVHEVGDVIAIGMLHEAGSLLTPPLTSAQVLRLSEAELFALHRIERRAAISIVRADERIADLAELVGSLFDDVVPSALVRMVAVADAYDYLTRGWPDRPALSHVNALRVLSARAGVQYNGAFIAALAAVM